MNRKRNQSRQLNQQTYWLNETSNDDDIKQVNQITHWHKYTTGFSFPLYWKFEKEIMSRLKKFTTCNNFYMTCPHTHMPCELQNCLLQSANNGRSSSSYQKTQIWCSCTKPYSFRTNLIPHIQFIKIYITGWKRLK